MAKTCWQCTYFNHYEAENFWLGFCRKHQRNVNITDMPCEAFRLMSVKVLQAIEKGYVLCKAISLYPNRLDVMLYSSSEKDESPTLLVKRVRNDRLNAMEIEVVFLGDYHLEKPMYFKKPKSEWISFGAVILSPQQARELGELLVKLGK